MTIIESYCRRIRDRIGIAHLSEVYMLRLYLKTLSAQQFCDELKVMTDIRDFRILQEVGIRAEFYECYMKRLKELV